LDLVITDELGKSDHAVLMIELNIFNSEPGIEQKINYNKGDYDALRAFIKDDWNVEFAADNVDLEAMWNTLKTKLTVVLNVFFH